MSVLWQAHENRPPPCPRKLQCTELLGHNVVLILKSRHMRCCNPECERRIFAEPLQFARPYARHTDRVEGEIRHEALGQTARKASRTLSRHGIRISTSSVTRRLRRLGKENPVVRNHRICRAGRFREEEGPQIYVRHCRPLYPASHCSL